jgi:nickel transport protein
MSATTTRTTAIAMVLLVAAATAQAHTVWLEEDPAQPGVYRMLFGGHAGQLEPLEPGKITAVEAFDADGQPVPLERVDGEHSSRIAVPAQAALVSVEYDNGIWSRDPMGRSVNLPLDQVAGATHATNALKFHKTILSWGPRAAEGLGQPFEVIPLEAGQPVAGEPMGVRVLLHGEPVADVQLGHGEEGDAGVTDADGIASVVPRPGFNRLWAGKRIPVEAATYTELSYEYLLAFEARSGE